MWLSWPIGLHTSNQQDAWKTKIWSPLQLLISHCFCSDPCVSAFLFCYLAAAPAWYCFWTYIWNLTFNFAICALSTLIPTILHGVSSLCVLVRTNVDAACFCKHATRSLENACFLFAITESLLDVWFNFWKSDCGCATYVQYLNTWCFK